jgi:mRNA-degrading endonuclease YafQ of YafQ-DinJ toxin-antitoxin module
MTWDIAYTSTFQKNFKRLPRRVQGGFFEMFDLFQADMYSPVLATHSLRGSMSGLLSSSIDTQYRFVTRVDTKNNKILLYNIGDHSIYQP